jgi:hypothetical protein
MNESAVCIIYSSDSQGHALADPMLSLYTLNTINAMLSMKIDSSTIPQATSPALHLFISFHSS